MQIVHFYETNPGRVVYAAHNRGVVTRRQVCDDRRFSSVSGRVATVENVADLVCDNNPADDCRRPVIVGGYQSSRAIVQLQGRISQCIRNVIRRRTELRTYGTNNYPLWY